MAEYITIIWFACGIIIFGIMMAVGGFGEGPVMSFIICMIAGPFVLAYLLVKAPFMFLEEREKNRLKALEEEYELEQIEERRLAREAKEAEEKAKKTAKTEQSKIFVKSNLSAVGERIANGEKSKQLIELILKISKHARVIKKSEIKGDFEELLPALRHARINVYEALNGTPEAKLKKIADELTLAIKRLS